LEVIKRFFSILKLFYLHEKLIDFFKIKKQIKRKIIFKILKSLKEIVNIKFIRK
jgi:hypothetical protein